MRLTKAVLLQLSALEARANSLNHRVSDFIELQSMVFPHVPCPSMFHTQVARHYKFVNSLFTMVHYGLLWFTTQRSACQGKLSFTIHAFLTSSGSSGCLLGR